MTLAVETWYILSDNKLITIILQTGTAQAPHSNNIEPEIIATS